MLDTYANRIRFVRSLTKLSRGDFEAKYGINRNTIKAWEHGVNILTEKSAQILSQAIHAEGFSCTPEWLIFGNGEEPRPMAKDDENTLLNSINDQSKIIYEADYFKRNNSSSIVYMITDKSMYPHFTCGDYVGGIKKSISTSLEDLINALCIFTLSEEIVLVRKFLLSNNKEVILYPTNPAYSPDITSLANIVSIAEIIWHRKIATR
jgi:transcriptional regulator with XRE-family HTH domain